jgi:hypothetical protein
MPISSTPGSVFGYHTIKTEPGPSSINTKESNASTNNWLQVAGYFPLVGLGVAIVRVIGISEAEYQARASALQADEKAAPLYSTSFKVTMYIRAFFEGIGAGIIFLLIDTVASMIRFSPCADQSDHRTIVTARHKDGSKTYTQLNSVLYNH